VPRCKDQRENKAAKCRLQLYSQDEDCFVKNKLRGAVKAKFSGEDSLEARFSHSNKQSNTWPSRSSTMCPSSNMLPGHPVQPVVKVCTLSTKSSSALTCSCGTLSWQSKSLWWFLSMIAYPWAGKWTPTGIFSNHVAPFWPSSQTAFSAIGKKPSRLWLHFPSIVRITRGARPRPPNSCVFMDRTCFPGLTVSTLLVSLSERWFWLPSVLWAHGSCACQIVERDCARARERYRARARERESARERALILLIFWFQLAQEAFCSMENNQNARQRPSPPGSDPGPACE